MIAVPHAPAVSRFHRRAMGSPLRLTVVGVEPNRAQTAWEVVSDRIEEIEQVLSRFRESSDLVALNRRAGDPAPAAVHPYLYAALAASRRAWRVTAGSFDPRVIADLERLGYGAVVAEPRAARPARAFDDREWLFRDPRSRRLAVAAPMDTGGIGKGLALRWAFAALAREIPEMEEPPPVDDGIGPLAVDEAGSMASAGALLEAGGDLVARGAAPDPGPWMVGLEHPSTEEQVAVIATIDGAVCTSSVAINRWTRPDGSHAHHLVDPRTGEPGGAGLLSVTVAGRDPAWAEVWSKALFLEGGRGIGPRARSLGLAAWWIRQDGTLEMTPAARLQTVWVAGEG